jgi:hypothetical protein
MGLRTSDETREKVERVHAIRGHVIYAVPLVPDVAQCDLTHLLI